MLLNLHVRNLALIDEVEVDFYDGLNILTGETGAGKSIIIGSINIAFGGKVTKDIIRKNADYALIELIFSVEDEEKIRLLRELDIPIDETGQLIISRKIMSIRTISRVNGENITSATLKKITSILIDIHGQHEHQSLLYKNKHLEILDSYAKADMADILVELKDVYDEYNEKKEELNNFSMDEEQRLRELSFLEFEIDEIENAHLRIGEDDELTSQYKKIVNAKRIAEGISEVYNTTEESSDMIGRAVKTLSSIAQYDEELNSILNQLMDAESILSDFNRDIMSYEDDISFDAEDYTKIESRLDLINNLKAKYGATIEDILAKIDEKRARYEMLTNYELEKEQLNKKIEEIEQRGFALSEKLSDIRQMRAKELTAKIKEALIDLNFLDVQFDMNFNRMQHFTRNGFDEAEFVISTNPGEDMRPLGKVASGGELSRIMLAIKTVLADNDEIETLIFDEIDVGISGRTAQKVSEKLAVIADNHQVICITHLPQITAMADNHYVIEKTTTGDRTNTNIRKLDYEESVTELARILGGVKITDAVMENAREMKELAKKR